MNAGTASSAAVLEAEALALAYDRPGATPDWVLRDVSLQLERGELMVLLGPSGAGKSSLLRILAGLQLPRRGTVRLFGEPLTQPHPRAAFVFQHASLLPWLDVQGNVGFGLDFRHQPRLTTTERRLRITTALDEVRLRHAAAARPHELSGGMAQRVSLARALARQPEVLLLDEPFSALDEATRADMQALLRGVVTRHGTAALLVTHDIDEALTLADRILLLGGHPASVICQWTLAHPFPRHDVALALNRQRVEILQALRHARQHRHAACTGVRAEFLEIPPCTAAS